MSDNKYNVDDILKEINTGRSVKKHKVNDSDINGILGKSDIDDLFTGVQNTNDDENPAERQKPDFSVTQIINTVSANKSTARQRTEDEVAERRNRELTEAVDKRKSEPVRVDEPFAARQLTDEQSEARLADEISYAAEVKKWERSAKPQNDDTRTFEDTLTFGNTAEIPDSDDNIELHSEKDFVTTDTMRLRKLNKINDINQALLMADSEADNPESALSGLNAMETRQKAEELISGDSNSNAGDTDTLAVAGNDLKRMAHGDEVIKEYRPTSSRKKNTAADDLLFTHTGIQKSALHVGETIVEALNKKISEEKKAAENPERSAENQNDTDVDAINSEDPVEKIRQANELAQKKKRKIASFILEGSSDTEEIEPQAAPENAPDDYNDTDEPVDLDDENVIRDRLNRAHKGLCGRLLILLALFAVTLFVAIANAFDMNLGKLTTIISYKFASENYLYTHLTVGILSFAACSSVISNGFGRLFKLRPDCDTLCAFAHTSAIVALVAYLAEQEFISRGRSQVYLCISLAALIFNTLSKLLTVRTAQKNFNFVFADRAKYCVECCGEASALQLAKGAVSGIPYVASMRKTEMLCDFIVSTYCEDLSDRLCRRLAPISLVTAFGGGLAAFFVSAGETSIMLNRVSWAATVCSAIFALTASFTGSLTVTLPLFLSALKSEKRGSAILGYEAAENLAETNAILIEAKSLFPANSVKISNICGYDKPRNRCEGKINIDEAIILAASLAVASDSVLSDAFFGMLNFKQELLKEVSGCVYENNLGVMGWIDRQRVLLGNRKHMMSHEISVPNIKKEKAANVNNDNVIYLAVGGEVCLLFFVRLTANPVVKKYIQNLSLNNIAQVIKTVDGMITVKAISELFEIDPEGVKVLPFEAHEAFTENTRFTSSSSAAVSCRGTFPSLAGAIFAARRIRSRTVISTIIQTAGIGLGALLAIIFALCINYGMFNMFFILYFNLGFAVLSLVLPLFKRT